MGKSKVIKFVVAGVIVLGVIVYLLITSFSQHSVYYLEVSELLANPSKYEEKGMRLAGDVVEGTIVKDGMNSKLLKFEIADLMGGKMNVEYTGVVPDAFMEGVSVIIEGHYDSEKKVFYAKTLLAKCPSKYETEDPRNHPDNMSDNASM